MKKDVFISYHTESAKVWVEQIAQQLEAQGIYCWYAPRDCENAWAEAIVQAIDTASIFLVLLNNQSVLSENVMTEIHIAHENLCKHKIRIIPFQIEGNCLSVPSLRYYLGRIHILNGSIPPVEDRILELVNRVRYLCNNQDSDETQWDEGGFVSSVVTPTTNLSHIPFAFFNKFKWPI